MIALDPALNPEDVFGISAEEMPGERLEQGESLQPFNPFLIAVPSSAVPGDQSPVFERYKNFFDAGVPTWVGGATYGLGVLSTPAAEVGGRSANPIAGMGFEELLTSDQSRGLLTQAGVTDADDVEWLAGPTPLADITGGEMQNPSPVQAAILDQETELESFLGVVSGDDGPWEVGVHMARIENDHDDGTDIVVAAGVHRWPVNTQDFLSREGERFTGILGSIITEARGLTASVDQRLRPITY